MLHGFLRRARIGSILLVSFFLVNISALAILGAVSYREVADVITTGAGQTSLATLREASKRLALRLSVAEDTAQNLSLSPAMERALQSHGTPFAEARALETVRDLIRPYHRFPEIAGINVLVPGWTVSPDQTGGIGLAAEEAVKDLPWYAPVEQFDAGWLGLHKNTIYPNSPAREVLTYIRKVLDTDTGERLGVVAVDIGFESIRPLVISGDWQGSLFVTGPSGEFVQQVVGPSHDGGLADLIRAQVARREAGYTPISLDGEPGLLLSTEPIHGGLRLVQAVPLDALTQGLRKIRLAFLWGGALCACLSLALAWVLSRGFVGPIEKLVGAMKRVGAGRLDVRVPERHQNEFGALEQGFNQMVARQEQSLADLKELFQRKRRAEVEMLQAQINPHFLYNTLDMVNWMAINEKQYQISEVITLLGQFFRLGLAKGETMVPLRQELEHLNTYLELQRIRFQGVFTVEEAFPPELLSCLVPKIVLQPFVENCLRHAFADTAMHGTIRLEGALSGGRVVLSVIDDGVGMAGETVPQPGRASTGYGVRNVHERIQVLFGSEYGVAVESEPMKGTQVRITLPLIREEERHADVVRNVG